LSFSNLIQAAPSIERALELLQTDQSLAALKMLNQLPAVNPTVEIYKSIALEGQNSLVSAIVILDDLVLRTDLAVEVRNQAASLRQQFIAKFSAATNGNWDSTNAPRISVIIDVGSSNIADFHITLRSLELQDYCALKVILLLGSESESAASENHLSMQRLLKTKFPRLNFEFDSSNPLSAQREPDGFKVSRLTSAANLVNGGIIAYVYHPIVYQFGALRIVAQLVRAKPEIEWMVGSRAFMGHLQIIGYFKRCSVTWNSEYFLDASRFRTPRADIEFSTLFFKADFLKLQITRLGQKKYTCAETALLATCFQETAPNLLTSTISLVVSSGDSSHVDEKEEPQISVAAIANKITTLSEFSRMGTPATQALPAIRISLVDDKDLRIEDLSQLKKVSITGVLPKISVIIPNFNQAHLLRICLASVVEQRYPKLELIVCDGGSSDGSQAVIQEFSAHINHLTSGPDAGHYAAVNAGLRSATGDILCWINSTDLLTPWSLHTAAAIFMQRSDVSWLTGRTATMTSSDKITQCSELLQASRGLYLAGKIDAPWIQQEGTFFRASLWKQAGSSLELSLNVAADLELWLRFFRFTPLHKTSAVLGIFRYHEGQRSEQSRHLYYQEALEMIERERQLVGLSAAHELRNVPPRTPITSLENLGCTSSSQALPFTAAALPLQARVSVEQSPKLSAHFEYSAVHDASIDSSNDRQNLSSQNQQLDRLKLTLASVLSAPRIAAPRGKQ